MIPPLTASSVFSGVGRSFIGARLGGVAVFGVSVFFVGSDVFPMIQPSVVAGAGDAQDYVSREGAVPVRPRCSSWVSGSSAVGGKVSLASNRAYWEGDRLITETMHALSGQTVTMREALTIAPDGKELFVERVVEVEHGYAMRGAKNNSMVRDVFVRMIP